MTQLNLILLVDDDDTTNYVNHRTLTRTQAAREIKVFTNGQQALQYLQQTCLPGMAATHPCPELIFLDIKMPVMDGFEFLEAYRQLGLEKTAPTKIMMLTSSASFYDLKRLETYEEVKRHFSKPLADQDIKELLRDYFPENREN
ncbi:MAG: response regulator [Adhaeribacter sp.]